MFSCRMFVVPAGGGGCVGGGGLFVNGRSRPPTAFMNVSIDMSGAFYVPGGLIAIVTHILRRWVAQSPQTPEAPTTPAVSFTWAATE